MTYDNVIIGAGILGLWAARHALRRGESVAVVEKREIGGGASGGFLGALMPHMPDNWNKKKQLQLDGLIQLPKAIDALQDDTDSNCGYRQCGRIMPLSHEKVLQQVSRRVDGAGKHWPDHQTMKVLDADAYGDWLNPKLAAHGIQHDTISARINPRATLFALAAYVKSRAEILEGIEVLKIDGTDVVLSNREVLSGGRVIVANGWEAYPLLQRYFDDFNDHKPIGRGVKGQAVLVAFEHDDTMPIVYHDGSYVVPHPENRLAIGSTSLNNWSGDADAFDVDDLSFYENALKLVPALADAPIVDQWAAVRPRNTLEGRGTSPWFGPTPLNDRVLALIGGFKITFGVAHLDFANGDFNAN